MMTQREFGILSFQTLLVMLGMLEQRKNALDKGKYFGAFTGRFI